MNFFLIIVSLSVVIMPNSMEKFIECVIKKPPHCSGQSTFTTNIDHPAYPFNNK